MGAAIGVVWILGIWNTCGKYFLEGACRSESSRKRRIPAMENVIPHDRAESSSRPILGVTDLELVT